jgi:hypothetical protein
VITVDVSDPQRLAMPDNYVHGFVHWLRNLGVDPHEFAYSYVQRTDELGYAPDLAMAVREFTLKAGLV